MSKRDVFLSLAAATGKTVISRQEIEDLCAENGINFPQWFAKDESNRAGRGLYKVPGTSASIVENVLPMKKPEPAPVIGSRIASVTTDLETENLIPTVYKNYVPFGNYQDLLAIVQSNQFFPIFITGQSGNGKTMSVEQACAKAKRKFVCISMTPDTDESDLLGNYVLINGQMEWRDGPVTVAARQGAVLCIDEIDYGAQNLSCLQRVLEGKPFMLKKKG